MQIGPHRIEPRVVLAPMAGVTDKPFRQLCKRLGAGLAVSEMTTSDPRFWNTRKSIHRMDHAGEPAPISVQIAGTEPAMLAEAAGFYLARHMPRPDALRIVAEALRQVAASDADTLATALLRLQPGHDWAAILAPGRNTGKS